VGVVFVDVKAGWSVIGGASDLAISALKFFEYIRVIFGITEFY
jgi:hypothetical protein